MVIDKIRERFNQNQPLFIGEDTAFQSAVLIPLVQVDGVWHVLFEVRSLKMRKQPGDISFPGGKIDPTDKSPLEAAVRETVEELGIKFESINVISELSPLVTSPKFVVYPFVAILDVKQIQINEHEVEEVFTIPLDWLLEYEPYMHYASVEVKPSTDFPFHKIMNGEQYEWRTRSMEEWFFDYEDYTIWGLTARILKYFVERLK
ncbi:nucleoside diphosphate hydrolase [Ureibacillus massiliensis 4400831 = CIP 108448 = CCUG 49529]|uniref:Nucleoside diphosphate hydrolase n=1 Tax=Ureibacillus massiliensis 4400831 = CIP 108448 = CCUG 49529 TaxID=1211035 RepID=A0A0A3J329_9BACL|nr:CoA pyrophosphatase [Ureibacillus massiliensis]KGR91301.1 nucleoside diphosphate hydrolase [Ureibacillus massiliensis 4400831 = CIP 108448 = CCUG 49529]